MEPADHPDVTGRDSFGRGRLSAAASQAARDQTRLQASQQAVASEVIAFQVLQQRTQLASGAEIDPARVAASLSAREREVIGLVAAGHSDGEIASELFISKKTASVHVANIKGKLGASSRVEIAMLAAKLHLVPDGVATMPGAARRRRARWHRRHVPVQGSRQLRRRRRRLLLRARARGRRARRPAGRDDLPRGRRAVRQRQVIRRPRRARPRAPGGRPARQRGLAPGRPAAGRPSARRPRAGAPRRDARRRPVDDEHPAEEWLDAPADGRSPRGRRRPVRGGVHRLPGSAASGRCSSTGWPPSPATPSDERSSPIAIRSEFYGRCAEHREIADLASASTVLLGPDGGGRAHPGDRAAGAGGRAAHGHVARARAGDRRPPAARRAADALVDAARAVAAARRPIAAHGDVPRHRRASAARSVASPRRSSVACRRMTRRIARSIFLRLATVGENGIASRRRVPITEIDGGHSPDVARVMAALVDGRLLTVDDGAVEPAHEALLREWPRMRQWLDDDGQARRLREHLVRSAREWDEAGREPGELYRGQRLGAALEWASTRRDELNDVERAFLDAGRKASEAELAGQRRINVRLRGCSAPSPCCSSSRSSPARWRSARRTRPAGWPTSPGPRRRTPGPWPTTPRRRPRRPRARARGIVTRGDPRAIRRSGVSSRWRPRDCCPSTRDVEARLREAWRADAVVDRIAPAPGRPPGVYRPRGRGRHARREGVGRRRRRGACSRSWTSRPARACGRTSSRTRAPWSTRHSSASTGPRSITSLFWISDADDTAPTGELGILVFDAATGRQVNRIDMGACGTLVTGVSAAGYLALLPPDDAARCYGSRESGSRLLARRSRHRRCPAGGQANLGDAKVSARRQGARVHHAGGDRRGEGPADRQEAVPGEHDDLPPGQRPVPRHQRVTGASPCSATSRPSSSTLQTGDVIEHAARRRGQPEPRHGLRAGR